MNNALNFAALDKEFSDCNKSKIMILPVPYEGTVTYGKGASKGPGAIIEASKNMELYDEELEMNICEIGIHTLNELEIKNTDRPEAVIEKLQQKVKELINNDKFPVILGGEHSISLAPVRALKEKYKNLSVLQLDAHSDLRDSYDKTKFSHACVMRRIFELCPIVQAGIRSMDEEEAVFIKNNGHKNIFYAKDIHDNVEWADELIEALSDNVYVTIDLDFLDPAIMPSVGTPEPGGLAWYQTLYLLRKVAERRNIVGFDVVELAPNGDNKAPDFTAAKLVYKLIGYTFYLR